MESTEKQTQRLIDRANYWLIVVGIYLAAIICYFPAMDGQFIWDDDYYVSNNAALRRGLDGLQDLWISIVPPTAYPVGIQYYPITHTTFWLQTRGHAWNTELSPIQFHVVNVLLHATSAWLLWTILRKLKVPGALMAAGLFLVHPVQVESVAWITERKNVLSGVFMFLSLLIYLRYSKLIEVPTPLPANASKKNKGLDLSLPSEPWKIYSLSLLLFVLGLLSKSVIGVLPAVILLIIWWKRGRINLAKDLPPLIPFFVLAIAVGSWTGWFERHVIGAIGPEWEFSFTDRLGIAGRAVWFYLMKLVAPYPLAFMYERWTIVPLNLVFGFGVLIVLGALFLMRQKIGRGPVTLALMFVGALVPALGFVNYLPQRYSFVADHFQYHAAAAAFVGVGYLVARYFKAADTWGLLLLIPFAALTLSQSQIYENRETLWADTVRKTPTSWMSWQNLGNARLDAGQLDSAADCFETALGLKPDNAESLQAIGMVAEKKGDLKTAFDLYHQAAKVFEQRRGFTGRPEINGSGPHYNMGVLLQIAGKRDEAIAQYEQALQLNNRHTLAMLNLSELVRAKGDYERAVALGETVLRIDPTSIDARMKIANARYDMFKRTGDQQLLQAAMEGWTEVGNANPNDPRVAASIGRIFADKGQFDAAIAFFEHALEIDPNYEVAKKNLTLAKELKRIAATQPSATQPATTQTAK